MPEKSFYFNVRGGILVHLPFSPIFNVSVLLGDSGGVTVEGPLRYSLMSRLPNINININHDNPASFKIKTELKNKAHFCFLFCSNTLEMSSPKPSM